MTRFIALVALLTSFPLSAQLRETQGTVIPVSAAPQLLIPAAGATAGANGTFFRSDITLINFGNTDRRVQLRWLPQAGGTGTTTEITLPASSGISSEDFVTQYLGVQGLGAILVTALTDAGATDPNGRLYATARIWTPQLNTTGFASQSLDIVPPSTAATVRASIFGLRRDSRYRMNVGVVNLDATATVTYAIAVAPGAEVYTLTLPPMTMQLVSLTATANPVSQVTIASNVSAPFVAFGSSIDNVTGDSWTELALPAAP